MSHPSFSLFLDGDSGRVLIDGREVQATFVDFKVAAGFDPVITVGLPRHSVQVHTSRADILLKLPDGSTMTSREWIEHERAKSKEAWKRIYGQQADSLWIKRAQIMAGRRIVRAIQRANSVWPPILHSLALLAAVFLVLCL